MSKNINIPKLRFKEFSGEWEEKRIENVFTILSGFSFLSLDASKSGVKLVKITDIGIQEMKKDNISFLPKSFLSKYDKFTLHTNDIVLALTRPILNKKLKISKIDEFFNNSLLNQRTGKIITKESLNYIYYLLQNEKLIDKINLSIMGSEPPNLSINQIKSLRASLPTKQEQEKIASFLTFVDTKIEQLTKKETLLKEYKKGVMQKIFNQEIRFKDDDYKLRTGNLIDFGSFYYGKGAPKTSVTKDAKTPCVRYGELYSTYKESIKEIKSYTNVNPNDLKLSKGGEVLVPRVGENPLDFANCSYLPFENVAIGEMISVYNTEENGLYITYYINAMLKKQLARFVEGGNVSNLYFRYVEKIEITIPSYKEQTKIVDFLSSIDSKIEQIQKQLEQTKKFKKALLQKMFV